jgi:hypothetical protein
MPGSFTENGTYVFDTNTIYTVYLEANVFSQPPAGVGDPSLSASVDPQFILPVGYSLELSPNIGNGPAGVPGPVAGAGLPGLAFAGAGFLAWWRRKRTAAGALAAV